MVIEKRAMRILMLNNEYPPLGGGQAGANKSIMEVLEKNSLGIRADLITSSLDQFKTESTKIGEIYYLNTGKKGKNIHYQNVKDLLGYSIKSFFYARKRIKKQPYDILLAWAGVPSGFIAFVLGKLFKIPYVILLRGPDVPFHESKWKIPDTLFFRFLSPLIWKHAALVVANSQELKKLANNLAQKQPVTVVENGVDSDFWKNSERKDLSLIEKQIILSVGRLSKIKGFDLAIRAVCKLDNRNIEYWLVGDGPEKNKLEQLAFSLHCTGRVKFLGVKNKMDLQKIYRKSSLFVLPSYNEGMSNALMEAMASGLPIIVTDVGGTQELLNGNGLLVEKGNSEAIAEAIRTMLSDNKAYKQMSHLSAKIAGERSWQVKTNELINYLRNITEK